MSLFRRAALPIAVCTGVGVALGTAYGADSSGQDQKKLAPKPVYLKALHHDTSPPLALMPVPARLAAKPREVPIQKPDFLKKRARPAPLSRDPLTGRRLPTRLLFPMPSPLVTFEGTSDVDNISVVGGAVVPPDTNGDVGPNHYVQWNNLVYEVFDKTGTSLKGPLPGNIIFSGFGGPCEATNDGDPIALYDRMADRWVLTQFAIDSGIQCIAVSQTGDPTGAFNRYSFSVTPGALNDYPKFGIWPTATNSAYMATFRRFPGFAIVAAAFERDQMLSGDPAQVVLFTLPAPAGAGCTGAGDCYEGVLPAHADGPRAPADGTPALLVMSFDDEAFSTVTHPTKDSYKIWKFAIDWATPANSTLTGPTSVDAPEMDIALCGFSACVPQKDSTELLDHLSFFTMNRAVYRKFADHEALFVNNTVNLGRDRAGIRWAELRDPAGTPALYQTGTHGPPDDVHRWMGSINVDRRGNVALGYSASGTDLFPSIRYAGRLSHDPLGMLPQTETELYGGTGSQTDSFSRWGDYSAMSIDPSDDCTFWFTTEYYQNTSGFDFHTRIGSFKFANCSADPSGVISGHITKASDGTPLAGAEVRAGGSATVTDATGAYTLELPVGTYDVSALSYGYIAQTTTGVSSTDGGTTTVDFALVAATPVTLSGTVLDGSGAGWPLYAKVVVTQIGPTTTLFTNPTTGRYSLTVFSNADYTVSVTAMVPGYAGSSRTASVGSRNQVEDFTLFIDAACVAPGYGFTSSASLLSESFDAGIPGSWSVVNGPTTCDGAGGGAWNTDDVQGQGNLTGGSSLFAQVNADACGAAAVINSDLVSPEFDLSGAGGSQRLLVSFNSDYFDACYDADAVSVDLWNGSAWIKARDMCGADRRGPRVETFNSAAANGVAHAKLRFHYKAGWDWFWSVDNVQASIAACQFGGGGVILGNVTDANTAAPLNDARVSLDSGQSTTTAPTPADADVADGFYLLYAPAGSRTLTVAKSRYATQNIPLTVAGGSVIRRDVVLAAGRLNATPPELRKRVKLGAVMSSTLTLANTGTAAAAFKMVEINAPAPATATRLGPAFRPQLPYDPTTAEGQAASVAATNPIASRPPDRGATVDTAALPIVPRAGEVVDELSSGLPQPWGISFNTDVPDLWVSNVAGAGIGDHQFLPDGTDTGGFIATAFAPSFAADMAYNSRTGMLWQVAVGGDNCLHELDPMAMIATGNRICAPFGTSLRGLAYNPASDTYFVGSWNGNFVAEVDGAGTILRGKTVDIPVSGLAYNPKTGHLFAQVSDFRQLIYVIDVNQDFRVLSAFPVLGASGPAFYFFEGAGLEMDCSGNLWAPNPGNQEVFVFKSGETGTCIIGVPWLSEIPAAGNVAGQGTAPISVQFSGAGQATGCHEAQLAVHNDTPYGASSLAVGITVQFNDVLRTTPGDRFIHGIAGADITHGCAFGRFCPARPLNRGTAAVWLLRSALGTGYAPPPAQGIFADVPPESFGADYIEDFYNRGIIASCNPRPPLRYCPNAAVTRGQLAALLLKTSQGSTYTPPACTGVFRDVPCGANPLAPFIEDAFKRGWMDACVVRPTFKSFCPVNPEPRWHAAKADSNAFGIPACKQ